jgi:hypothetical protein
MMAMLRSPVAICGNGLSRRVILAPSAIAGPLHESRTKSCSGCRAPVSGQGEDRGSARRFRQSTRSDHRMARCELRCRWVDLNPIEYTRRCERRARDLFRRCDDRERIRRSLVRLAEGRDRRWGLSRPRRRAEITGWSGPAQDAVIGIRNLSSAVTRFAGNTLTDPLVSERKVITGVIDGRVIQTGPDRPQIWRVPYYA